VVKDQYLLDIFDEIFVDNFAGGGGASTGYEMATGRYVELAANHDEEALAMHRANHPQTQHLITDIWDVDPYEVTQGRPVAGAWFSPDCTHHSKARNGKPKSKYNRGLAWASLKWAGTAKPRVIFLENVEEFPDWCQLICKRDPDTGRCIRVDHVKVGRKIKIIQSVAASGEHLPIEHQMLIQDTQRRGSIYRKLLSEFRREGYNRIETREIRSSDFGAPTSRKRFYLIARRDDRPIVWPNATHGDPNSEAVITGKLKPWKLAADCIEFHLPCTSIFDKSYRPATLARVCRGVEKFVIDSTHPYLCLIDGSSLEADHITKFNTGSTGSDMRYPLPTITAGPKKHPAGAAHGLGLVSATLIQTGYGERKGQKPRVPGLDKPLGTVVAGGAKHALVAAHLAKNYTGVTGSPIDEPLHTITSVDHHSLVATHLVRQFGASTGSPTDSPLGTIVAGGCGKTSLAVSTLAKRDHPATDPDRHHLVQEFLFKYGNPKGLPKEKLGLVTINGEEYRITDIKLRMLRPRELFRAQGFPSNYKITPLTRNKKGILRPLPQHAQVRMCGNSVSPPVAAALIAANLPELSIWGESERDWREAA
jgi:DNA (cytosine-5)-methyltransferase 1